MNPEQIALVQGSFREIVPIKDLAAKIFYERLFELDPALRPLFRASLHEQGQKLMTALAAVVGGLTRWDRVEPVLRELGRRHVAYGVRPDHYDTVGDAFLWALDRGLGDSFTAEVKSAWEAAYRAVAGAMIDAAKTQAA
jgi:hemoglobin-like flavoprotein